ncbi:MAG: 4-(cytidine 5'-diphospho)-2-C-methyl-D-erythritol kinase [Ruminococcus flavefaciens]|nr:4-(cytidine 5'-diphospho)-2-C-methyl-D-erythritol kinase [Ruminococcus flavefaciens]MCM1230443.1 4-(cytidine 5'-diphospho)-2-C-methyl-D-erythritol kinase [Ruminococcus flavefaciens]
MKVKTAAKINLALDVTGKLPNGYHEIESVFQTVGIYDEVEVKLTEKRKITVICSDDCIPCDERNIAYKAAKAFLDENNLDVGCKIRIKKVIPTQAGMGGGSSDAAAVLFCLNKITGKTFSAPEKIGADVPFFLTGGTAYVTGIGEKVTPIADYSGRILVIAQGYEGVSTAEAYKKIDELQNPAPIRVKEMVSAINEGRDITPYIGNIFEEAMYISNVHDIEDEMWRHGASSPCMTGSGSAVFGFFDDMQKAQECYYALLETDFYSAYICETVPESFIIIR